MRLFMFLGRSSPRPLYRNFHLRPLLINNYKRRIAKITKNCIRIQKLIFLLVLHLIDKGNMLIYEFVESILNILFFILNQYIYD